MDMFTPLIEHLKTHQGAYIAVGIVAAAVFAVFRRFAAPIVAKVLEVSIYCSAMHVAVALFVRMVAWFKGETSLRALHETGEDLMPDWTTPFIQFWNRDLYQPRWLVYLELAFVVIILGLVWRFRPIFIKPKRQKTAGPPPEKMKAIDRFMSGSPLSKEGLDGGGADAKKKKKGRW